MSEEKANETKPCPVHVERVNSQDEIIKTVEPLLAKNDSQELIYLQLDPSKYPNRLNSLSMDVRKYLMTHPRVKVDWDNYINVDIGQDIEVE